MLHVLGAGSLGLLWSARLALAGQPVTLLLRSPEALAAWQAAGSQVLFEHQGQCQSLTLHAALAGDPAQQISHLIVATKAQGVAAALQQVAAQLSEHCQLLMLQNGLGSQQWASQQFQGLPVLYASVTDGAWRPAARHVVWAGSGTTLIGSAGGSAEPHWLKQHLAGAIDWQWHPRIMDILWLKLAVNCAINPLSVLHDCLNGEVPSRAGTRLPALIGELQSLLQAEGQSLLPGQLSGHIHQVIERTAQNSSSMRQDVHAGRPTEIDYILGHALHSARSHGLDTPMMDQLDHELRTHLATLGLLQAR